MRIVEVAAFAVDVPFSRGTYTMSGGRTLSSVATTVVRVTTDTGFVGYGEAGTGGSMYMEAFAGSVRAALDELGPAVIGLDPAQPALVNARLDATLRGHGPAKAAIDIACLDAAGHALGRPVADLLGGRFAERVPVFDAISLGTPDAMAEYARNIRDAGIRRYQLKLGDNPAVDRERLAAVADAVGGWDFMTCDANGGWTLAQATRMVHAIAEFDVFVEQPCLTLAEVASVRARTHLPVIVDEVIVTQAALVDAINLGAADGVNVKPSRVGGLTKAARLRDLAVSVGLSLVVDEAGGADIAQAAMVHLAASTPPHHLLGCSSTDGYALHLSGETRIRTSAGAAVLSDAPGLGITVDEALLGQPLRVFR